jgi:pimeloyl-ACP methyl ester carboxylesterase
VTRRCYRGETGGAAVDQGADDLLNGEADGVGPAAGSEGAARHFTGSYVRRVIPVAGHFLPREAPDTVVAAIKELGGIENPTFGVGTGPKR